MAGAVLAAYPAAGAVGVVLFFPDGYAVFHFVDDVAAGIEGFATVGGAYGNPHGIVTNCQLPDAVDAARLPDGEALLGNANNALAFFFSEGCTVNAKAI